MPRADSESPGQAARMPDWAFIVRLQDHRILQNISTEEKSLNVCAVAHTSLGLLS